MGIVAKPRINRTVNKLGGNTEQKHARQYGNQGKHPRQPTRNLLGGCQQQADFSLRVFGGHITQRTLGQNLPIHDRAHCTQGSLKRVVLGRKRTNGNAIAVGQWMEGQFVLNRAVVVEQLVELEFIRRHGRR